jgi:spermidine synthase
VFGAALAAVVFVLWRFNAIDVGIFTAGFTASSIEIVLLIVFQILYGSVYGMTAIVITVFMGGLAAGAFVAVRRFPLAGIDAFIRIQIAVAIFCVFLPALFGLLQDMSGMPSVVHAGFVLLVFVLAFCVGSEFSFASAARSGSVESVASGLYGTDLLGSALGALLASTYMIPLLGVMTSSAVAAIVSAAGALVCLGAKKRRGLAEVRDG